MGGGRLGRPRIPPAPRGAALARRRARVEGDLAPAPEPPERSRPLWGVHADRRPARRRFALYMKIHHALADGVGDDAAAHAGPGRIAARHQPAALVGTHRHGTAAKPTQSGDEDWRRFFERPLRRPGQAQGPSGRREPLAARPRCLLNGSTTGRRRFATQDIELGRVKAWRRRPMPPSTTPCSPSAAARCAATWPSSIASQRPAAGQHPGGLPARARADDRQFGGWRPRLDRHPSGGSARAG